MFNLDNLERDCNRLLDDNYKIQAIKEFRNQTGWGLKESKYAIDDLQTMGRFSDSTRSQLTAQFKPEPLKLGVTWHMRTLLGQTFDISGLTEEAANGIMAVLARQDSYGEFA